MAIRIGAKGATISGITYPPYAYIDWLTPDQEALAIQGGDAYAVPSTAARLPSMTAPEFAALVAASGLAVGSAYNVAGTLYVATAANSYAPVGGSGSGLALTYTAAQLDAFAQSGTTPSPAPTAPFPQLHAAIDDATRTWLVSSATTAMETTVLPLTKDIADTLAATVSHTAPTLIASFDAKDFARAAFFLKNLDADPLTTLELVCRNDPADPWTVTHGTGAGPFVTGAAPNLAIADDGFLLSVVAPRNPCVLAQDESAFIKFICEGARYWGVRAQVSGAASGTANLTGVKLLRGN